MPRKFILLLVAAMILAACGGGAGDDAAEDQPEPDEAAATSPDPTPEAEDDPAEPEPTEDADDAAEEDATEEPEAEPEPEGADFSGETVTILVPFSPGGGADTSARLVGQFISQHIPGEPSIVVENVTGGGGSTAMRDMMDRRASDGTVMTAAGSGVVLRHMLGEEGHDYPLADMGVVGATSGTVVTVFNSRVGDDVFEAIEYSQTTPLIIGEASAGNLGSLHQLIAAELLGLEIDVVYGFGGTAETAPAIERGDLDGSGPSDLGAVQTFTPLFESGLAFPGFQSGFLLDGEVVPSPLMPEVPLVRDLYEELNGEPMSGELGEAFELIEAFGAITPTVMVMHPDVPQDRLETLANAWEALLASEEWSTRTTESFGAPSPGLTAEGARSALDLLLGADEGVLEVLRVASAEN